MYRHVLYMHFHQKSMSNHSSGQLRKAVLKKSNNHCMRWIATAMLDDPPASYHAHPAKAADL